MSDPSQSKISRWVSFGLGSLASLAAAFIAHAALSVFGIHLDPTGTAIFLSTVFAGAAAIVQKWVHNRGLFEIAHFLHIKPPELESVIKLMEERLPVPPSAAGQPKQAHAPPASGVTPPPPGPPNPPKPPHHRPAA